MINVIINGSLAAKTTAGQKFVYSNVIELANKDVNDSGFEITFKLIIGGKIESQGSLSYNSGEFDTTEWFDDNKSGDLEFTITKSDSNS